LIGLGLIAVLGSWSLHVREAQPVTVMVPAHNLPSYHSITKNDLTEVSLLPDEVPSDAVRTESEMMGRYTREPLIAKKTVPGKSLVPASASALNVNAVVVSVPATAAMTFGGRLASGDIVMLWNVPANRFSTSKPILDQALVLDVLATSAGQSTTTEKYSYAVILAVPVDQQVEVMSAAAKGSLAFTLSP